MKVIKTKNGIEGYYYLDIVKRYPDFPKWFSGQTGMIYKGKMLVYRHDYERYIRGEEVID